LFLQDNTCISIVIFSAHAQVVYVLVPLIAANQLINNSRWIIIFKLNSIIDVGEVVGR
jgi:hypothetical protein